MYLKTAFVTSLIALTALPALAQEPSNETGGGAAPLSKEDVSYTVGVLFGRQMHYGEDLLDTEIMVKAMNDVFLGKDLEMSDEEMQMVLNRLSSIMQENRAEEMTAEGSEFLASKREEPGVQVTGSGLMYKVIEEGSGESPEATDTVRVNYTGKFTDGTVFDSSEDRGPAQFQLNQVIPGWTEGLQLMKEGAKYEFYIPYTLAYGESGMPRGGIPPYATLVFEVELLEIVDEPAQ